jgi:hypothetical protein
VRVFSLIPELEERKEQENSRQRIACISYGSEQKEQMEQSSIRHNQREGGGGGDMCKTESIKNVPAF